MSFNNEIFFTGFEGGESSGRMQSGPFRGGIVGDGTARSGEYYCRHYTNEILPNSYQLAKFKNAGVMGQNLSSDEMIRVNYRVFFRLNEAPTGTIFGGGIGFSNERQGGYFAINTVRRIASVSDTLPGTFTTAALTLGQWYRIDLKYTNQQVNIGINRGCFTSTQVSLYSESGVLIEAAAVASTSFPTDSVSLSGTIAIGNCTIFSSSSSANYDYDDLYAETRTYARFETPNDFDFPLATRIARVSPIGQGTFHDWTGDWRTIACIPREDTEVSEQVSSIVGAKSTFVHDTAANLGLGNIAGVTVYANVATSSADPTVNVFSDALLIGSFAEYLFPTVGIGYQAPEVSGVDSSAWTHANFNAMEFGIRNKRGTTLRLGKCYLEVLHDGLALNRPRFIDGTGGYKHKLVSWTGNGAYQDITNVGFGAQAVWIKPVNGAANIGALKLAMSGGTLAWKTSQATISNGILEITSTGCKLGPNVNVNALGVTYIGLFMQDGGTGSNGPLFDCGTYPGNGADNRNIVLNRVFQPDVVITGCGSRWRTSAMGAGDVSLSLTNNGITYPDGIQQFNANGFQIGQAATVNPTGGGDYKSMTLYLAIKQGTLGVIQTGKSPVGAGSIIVSGMLFAPFFVIAQQHSASTPVVGQYKATEGFTGNNGRTFDGQTNTTTGITILSSDGWSGGAQLVQFAGQDMHWLAFGPFELSGLYYMNKAAKHDFFYKDIEKKIPNPTIRTALIGE